MKKLLVVLVLALGIFFLFAPQFAGAQDERSGEQSEEIAKRKPAATSTGLISNVTKPAKVLDGSIDVTMGRGVTRSFTNVRIGDFHPETYYFDEILEKPDFMTFRTDAVKKVISPSPTRTVVDFTLTSANDASLGDFTIRVKYTFHFGGPALTDEILTINLTIADIPAPVADFTATPTSGPRSLRVQFTDKSSGEITSRLWEFGDGYTSTATNPVNYYTAVGTYTVSLTVSGPGGDDKKTRKDYITVTEPPPVANFSATPRSGVKPLTVQFTDLSSGEITSRSWNFGDGQTSSQEDPSHTYTAAGTYTVALTVTGPGGSNTSTRANYITVREPPPVADFTAAPTTGVKPLTVQFTDASTGQITSRSWNFGDGKSTVETNPSHVYANAGTYTVSLTVSGPGGTNTKSRVGYITVNEIRPTADFMGSPTSGQKPLGVQFSDKSTGVITVRVWDFGDGQTSSSTNPSHMYTEVGSYTVTLIVAGPGGSDTTAKANYITVTEPPPVANFTATPGSGVKPLAVQFTNTSTGQYDSQSWNFGDGQTSTETNPSHTFADVGTYTVSLTVTGPGGSNTKTQPGYITVSEPAPVADFTAVPTIGKKPMTVQFLNSSTGVITGYAWNFGDGQTSTEKNPSHVYTSVDTYTVALTVTGPGGSDTATKTNYITVSEPAPVADFTSVPTSGKKPLTVQFLDNSAGLITSRSWNFGDGQTSIETNPSHRYAEADTYTVALTVTGPGGSHTKTREKYIIVIETTAVEGEENGGVPTEFVLFQNYPNPFNPSTEIRFQLPEANHVVVKIFNTVGEEIRTLLDAPYEAGYHRVHWDGKDKNGNAVASGVYLYQLRAGNFSQVRKMSLLR